LLNVCIQHLTKELAVESRLRKDPIEIFYADVHNVNSATNHLEVSLLAPSSDTMAQAIIDVVGCGSSFVTPYWLHEIARYATYILPRGLLEYATNETIKKIIQAKELWESRKGRLEQ
jgi:hypothetical protein